MDGEWNQIDGDGTYFPSVVCSWAGFGCPNHASRFGIGFCNDCLKACQRGSLAVHRRIKALLRLRRGPSRRPAVAVMGKELSAAVTAVQQRYSGRQPCWSGRNFRKGRK